MAGKLKRKAAKWGKGAFQGAKGIICQLYQADPEHRNHEPRDRSSLDAESPEDDEG